MSGSDYFGIYGQGGYVPYEHRALEYTMHVIDRYKALSCKSLSQNPTIFKVGVPTSEIF